MPASGPLFAPVVDKVSGQPELKHVPVRLRREPVAWTGLLISRRDMRPTGFVHWSRQKVDGGWVYELCGTELPDQGILLARGLTRSGRSRGDNRICGPQWVRNYRAAAMDEDGALMEALFVAPTRQLPARDWLLSLLATRARLSPIDRMALLVGAVAGRRCRRRAVSYAPASTWANTRSRMQPRPVCRHGRRYRPGSAGRNQLRLLPRRNQEVLSMKIVSRQPSETVPARIGALSVLPVFLDLAGKRAVVAGGSEAAAWKAELLAAAGARVDLYASANCPTKRPALLATRARESRTMRANLGPCAALPGAAVALADAKDDLEAATFESALRVPRGCPATS
jgi:hypothetical protein